MLVVDRSKSMEEDFGTDTRWNVLREALINPTDGFVTTLETQIRFGLSMYTGPLMSGGGGMPRPGTGGSGGGGGGTATGGVSNECPILAGVPIALNNFAQIGLLPRRRTPGQYPHRFQHRRHRAADSGARSGPVPGTARDGARHRW